MVAEPATATDRAPAASLLLQGAFVGLLYLVLVGLEPFKVRDLDDLVTASQGDVFRQMAFASAYVVILLTAPRRFERGSILGMPLSVWLVLGWCATSMLWSVAPDVSLRRLLLTGMIISATLLAVSNIGPERSLAILRAMLATLLIINLLSIFIVPQAVHLPGESGEALVGNWRGLHFHKNLAGSIAAMSTLLFFFEATSRGRRIDWLLFVVGCVFVIGTGSRTSTILLGGTLVATLAYTFMQRTAYQRQVMSAITWAFLAYMAVVSMLFRDDLVAALTDSSALTGRGAIWRVALQYMSEHPLGAGFGAFWQTGSLSPLAEIARDSWVIDASHSHNGYIEAAVTIGLVGLGLVLLVFVIRPFWIALTVPGRYNSYIFSTILFFALLNLTETRLLDRDRPEWVLFLIAFGIQRMTALHRGKT